MKLLEETLVMSFDKLLEEAPLDFMGTGDNMSEALEEKYWQENCDAYRAHLRSVGANVTELSAKVVHLESRLNLALSKLKKLVAELDKS